MEKKADMTETVVRQMSLRDSGVRLRDKGEGSRGITGYAILFDTPSDTLYADEQQEIREVIAPEAVTRDLLDASDIKFTMYHDRQILLGRSVNGQGTLSYFIDEKGVGFELELPQSPNGDEALEMVRRGDISGCSFMFSTRYRDRDHVERRVESVDGRKLVTYRVKKITGIYDFTLAADPAYPATSVEAREFGLSLRVKPGTEDIRLKPDVGKRDGATGDSEAATGDSEAATGDSEASPGWREQVRQMRQMRQAFRKN